MSKIERNQELDVYFGVLSTKKNDIKKPEGSIRYGILVDLCLFIIIQKVLFFQYKNNRSGKYKREQEQERLSDDYYLNYNNQH